MQLALGLHQLFPELLAGFESLKGGRADVGLGWQLVLLFLVFSEFALSHAKEDFSMFMNVHIAANGGASEFVGFCCRILAGSKSGKWPATLSNILLKRRSKKAEYDRMMILMRVKQIQFVWRTGKSPGNPRLRNSNIVKPLLLPCACGHITHDSFESVG